MSIGSNAFKRTASLYAQIPERLIDIHETWKKRHPVPGSQSSLDTHKRQVVPASNTNREPEDGCMKKVRIERALKQRKEDCRERDFNIIGGH